MPSDISRALILLFAGYALTSALLMPWHEADGRAWEQQLRDPRCVRQGRDPSWTESSMLY